MEVCYRHVYYEKDNDVVQAMKFQLRWILSYLQVSLSALLILMFSHHVQMIWINNFWLYSCVFKL